MRFDRTKQKRFVKLPGSATSRRMDLTSTAGRRRAWLDSLFDDHAALRTVWTNFHTVAPGVLYRSNHPTPGNLRRFVRIKGIKTVINLRGMAGNGSDALSREAARVLGLDFIDLAVRSAVAPPRETVLELMRLYRTMRRPGLVHCKSGADRAGFASAVFLLMEGTSVAEARAQMALRFGHMRHSRAGILSAFIGAWERYAGEKSFARWVAEDYDSAALQAGFKSGLLSRFVNDRVLSRE
jgi:protein tyrosine/serine phosphatase